MSDRPPTRARVGDRVTLDGECDCPTCGGAVYVVKDIYREPDLPRSPGAWHALLSRNARSGIRVLASRITPTTERTPS